MNRLEDIRGRVEADRRGEMSTVIFGAYARADIPYLLGLVERAVPFVDWFTQHSKPNPAATQWLRDVDSSEEGEG